LARRAAEVAPEVERAVFDERKSADRALAILARSWRDLTPSEVRQVSRSVLSLFRWHGWVELLGPGTVEERLLVSTLLESREVPPICRSWARRSGWDFGRLFPLGDAPTWHSLVDGLGQLLGERPVSGDPWRLFPTWLREELATLPGLANPKAFQLDFLRTMQAPPPLWVRAQGPSPEQVWTALRELGLRPWVHRHMPTAGRLDQDVDITDLPSFHKGEIEPQDLSAQVVGHICDPDPGERWWDACAGTGGMARHLASLMKERGQVVASDVVEAKWREAARRARRGPFRNLTTRPWDGRHVVGKAGSYHGVLVDAPSSGLSAWRRHPDDRWRADHHTIKDSAKAQLAILEAVVPALRPGGTLVYTVATVTPTETTRLVAAFLDRHAEIRLDPFPNPLDGTATDGTLWVWPQQVDADARFVARFSRR
jgi:16S rRNA (cytosine967-C5)-methyltransferase